MGKRIHIVGISPRTGTSLMHELIVNCFEVTGSSSHEMSVLKPAPEECEVFCSKKPADLELVAPLLRIDPEIWFVCMIRDPRDIIVSRHKKAPDKFWTHLRFWHERYPMVQEAMGHPNFVFVRYEDLVQHAGQVQETLMQRMPFLKFRSSFLDFHKASAPTKSALEALGSLRPIDTRSIGVWRQQKPRVAAQLEIHGSIDTSLIEFGYESDGSWQSELQGFTPDNGESYWSEAPSRRWQFIRVFRKRLRRWRRLRRYARVVAKRV